MRGYHDYKNYSNRAKIIAWGIDILGGIVYNGVKIFTFPLRFFFRQTIHPHSLSPRILLIRLDHIGDVLMTTPAIHALRRHYPKSFLAILVSPSSYPIVENNPDIDKIYTFNVPWFDGGRSQRISLKAYFQLLRILRKERFDIAVDCRGDFRVLFLFSFLSGSRRRVGFTHLGGEFLLSDGVDYDEHKHFVELNFDLINSLDVPVHSGIHYYIHSSDEDKSYIQTMLTEFGIIEDDMIIGIHPTTIPHWKLKRWRQDRFAELADQLSVKYKAKIVFTGSEHDRESIQRICSLMKETAYNAAGKTSLHQLAMLISFCQLFISNDSGPMHIAVAVKTPLVAIFGPTNPKKSGPYGNPELYRVVQHSVLCPYPCFVTECSRNHECMEEITVKNVLHVCQDLFLIGDETH